MARTTYKKKIMRKLIFVFLFSFVAIVSYSQVNVLKVDYEEGLKLAKQQGKLVLVDCTTDGG